MNDLGLPRAVATIRRVDQKWPDSLTSTRDREVFAEEFAAQRMVSKNNRGASPIVYASRCLESSRAMGQLAD